MSANRQTFRQRLFQAIALLFSVALTIIVSEILLHVYSNHVTTESMQPGLVQRDAKLGWKLAPNWKGEHEHYDYKVSYATNFKRERVVEKNVATESEGSRSERVLIVGDSFTFGLGVGNQDTFSQLLQHKRANFEVINGGVPGYSPEQIGLRAIDLAKRYTPAHTFFVVYLGNDLVDIGYEYAVQAPGGKPFLTLDDQGGGSFANLPVVQKPASEKLGNRTLGSRVIKPDASLSAFLGGLLSGSKVLQLLGSEMLSLAELDVEKIDVSVELLAELLRMINDEIASDTVVVLLPGAGAFGPGEGLTKTYQMTLRDKLLDVFEERGVKYVDLYDDLKKESNGNYFPNDGHLTAQGHAIVAEKLAVALP